MARTGSCEEALLETSGCSLHAVRLQNLRWRMASAGREEGQAELPSSLRGLAEDHCMMRFNSPDAPRRRSKPQAKRRRPSWPSFRRRPPVVRRPPEPPGLTLGGLARVGKVVSIGGLLDVEGMKTSRLKKSVSFSQTLEVEVPILHYAPERQPNRPHPEELARANLARLVANNERVMRRASAWRPPTLCEVRARLLCVAGCLLEGNPLRICGKGHRNPNLLPGYTLRVAWQDTRCSPTRGRSMALRNLFEQEYVMFAPGTETHQLDINHDGTMAEEETETFQQVWNVSRLAPGPVGILGPVCSGAAMQVVPIGFRARLPIVSGSTTFPGLSDRAKFPNFYRTVLPDTSLSQSFVRLSKLMGHTDIIVMTGTDSAWADQAQAIAQIADSDGVTLHGIDFTSEIPLFKGYRVASPGSIELAVSQMVQLKKRIIVMLLYTPEVRHILCFTYKAHFTTGVYMTFGWADNGLWLTAADTSCSAAEINSQAQKAFIGSQMEYWRSDDTTTHSCTDNVTVADFKLKWWASMNVTPGDTARNPDGYPVFQEGGTFADAVCFLALMYHEMLFNAGYTLADLAARTQDVYDAEQRFLETLGFEGTTGRIQFQPGVADPSAGMTIVQAVGASFEPIGTYNNGQLAFKQGKSMKFKLPGETFDACSLTSCTPGPLQHYSACPNFGEVLNFSSNTCGDCPPGSSYLVSGCVCLPGYYGAGGICQPCQAGTFSKSSGQQSCEACPLGQFSVPPARSCQYCSKGTFANATGMARCTDCPAHHTTADVGSTSQGSCDCSAGYYSAAGLPGCQRCPNSSSTAQPFASRGISSCLCPEDTFMNSDSVCQACPSSSSTQGPGRTSVKSCLCQHGLYMPLDYTEGCKECPATNECPLGSNEANEQFLDIPRSNRSVEQRFLDLAPRHWSTRERPMEVYVCGSEERCPGHRSPGNACTDRLVGIACEHCEAGFYWDGRACEVCKGYQTNVLFFPVLPLLISPFFLWVLYLLVGDPPNRLGSWVNASFSLCFVLLSFLQTLGSMADLNMAVPKFLQEQLNIYSTTSTAAANVYYECHRIRGIVGVQAVRGSYPIAVVLAALAAWSGSRAAAKVLVRPGLVMEGNRTLNTVGTVFFTFHHALIGVSLLVFKCTDNPENAPPTLSADLSVVCWESDTWKDAVGIGVLCFIIYSIGLTSLWAREIWQAPTRFEDESWRMRWKFLFVRWESGRYAWSCCYMLRNLFLNLVPCLVTSEAAVLYLTMMVIVVYSAGIILKMPFRTLIANYFEVFSGLCMLFVVSLLTWWADRLNFVFEAKDHLTTAAMLISFFPVVLLPFGILHLFMRRKLGKPTPTAKARAEKKFNWMRKSLKEFTKLSSETGETVMLNLAETDLSTLKHAAFLITTDVFHQGNRRRLAGGYRVSHITGNINDDDDPNGTSGAATVSVSHV